MSEQIVVTRGLAVGYGSKTVVQNIEIKLHRGEILTIVGPNGSGKTTILKSIAGQLNPIRGEVLLSGDNMEALSGNAIARKLALVLTLRMRADRMNCEEIVAAGRYPYTGKLGILSAQDQAQVHRAMQLVHTLELRTTDFNTISDGQRQRVLLARAICQNPEVIVLDEPTSFLDIKYKLELLATLKTMAREQKMAIVLSLHELDLAQKISDTVLCVKDGQIERYGTPDAVFTEGYIRHLYDLSNGSYNSTFGCLELAAPSGVPEVFVIAGGDSASGTFRALQRQGIPFATGVLHPGDVDYSVATALAAVVICEKPFEPISRARIEEAKQVLRQCRRVICCLSVFGSMNQGNEELLRFAENQGLLVDDTATGLHSAGK